LGPGWKMPADIRLQLRDNTLILSDNGGRSLYFEHLFPGEDGYDRSNTQVRSFTYDDKYRGRMVAHRHTGRPEIRYRYDSDGRV
ncbi:hypothetical protein, partial [Escherichia coli]|uniref:hypothetical protein n=1 Tax=Escherichia coli TaxID=562 RepID=UPI00191C7B7E